MTPDPDVNTDVDGNIETDMEADIERLIGAMTLDEKTSLTAGAGMWYLPPIERLGIPALKVSDGPSGVRGDSLVGRRSLSLPCGTAVGSTWNPELARALGGVLAAEARSKGVHVLLGPTVCIVRTPLAGRTFESFSEDPLLTARLAGAYVVGVQAGGVACCIKHFACNDQEHERMTISAEVEERPLREIHLVAFEHAVREAGVWSVMTAYNKVNGVYCGEQADLIGGVLRSEWGFDGLVMSDWFGTHSTAPAALAGLDLEMPGPSAWLGPTLAAAVRDHQVDESVVDGQVRHVLRLMGRVGILGRTTTPDEQEEDDPGRRAVARRVAAEGTVLLVNDGLLPLDPGRVATIAVIGPNAGQLAMGGGSSEVTPHRRRRVDEALAERFPGAVVMSEVGCRIDPGLPPIDLRLLSVGRRRVPPHRVLRQPRASPALPSPRARRTPPGSCGSARPSRASPSERARCACRRRSCPMCRARGSSGSRAPGGPSSSLTATSSSTTPSPSRGSGFYGAGTEPVEVTMDLAAGHRYDLVVEIWPRSSSSPIMGARIGASPPDTGDEFERAVARRRRRGRRRGRGRLERAVGVRGTRPAGPRAARPAARARRGGPGGQPAHRGGRQRRLPRRPAVGGAGRGVAHDVVPGRGGGGRAGRHARRGGRAVGTAAGDVPRQRRGRPGRTGRGGRSVSGHRGQGGLRGGRPRRLPLLRDDPPGAALPLRLRPLLRRHRLRRRARRRGRG